MPVWWPGENITHYASSKSVSNGLSKDPNSTVLEAIANGSPSSSDLQSQFAPLSTQGQSILDDMNTVQDTTLFRFEQGLSGVERPPSTGSPRKCTGYRLLVVVSDMLDIDQTMTSATVRADAGAVTLRENSRPAETSIRNLAFSSDIGAVEQFTGMYRIYGVSGTDGGWIRLPPIFGKPPIKILT